MLELFFCMVINNKLELIGIPHHRVKLSLASTKWGSKLWGETTHDPKFCTSTCRSSKCHTWMNVKDYLSRLLHPCKLTARPYNSVLPMPKNLPFCSYLFPGAPAWKAFGGGNPPTNGYVAATNLYYTPNWHLFLKVNPLNPSRPMAELTIKTRGPTWIPGMGRNSSLPIKQLSECSESKVKNCQR